MYYVLGKSSTQLFDKILGDEKLKLLLGNNKLIVERFIILKKSFFYVCVTGEAYTINPLTYFTFLI